MKVGVGEVFSIGDTQLIVAFAYPDLSVEIVEYEPDPQAEPQLTKQQEKDPSGIDERLRAAGIR